MSMNKTALRKITICMFLILFLAPFFSSGLFAAGLTKLSESKGVLGISQNVASIYIASGEGDDTTTPSPEPGPTPDGGDILTQ